MLLRAVAFVVGVTGAAVPKRVIDVLGRIVLTGYENPDALEPEDWYVDLVRIKFAIIAVAALIAPFLPTPGTDGEAVADDGPVVDVIEGTTEQ